MQRRQQADVRVESRNCQTIAMVANELITGKKIDRAEEPSTRLIATADGEQQADDDLERHGHAR